MSLSASPPESHAESRYVPELDGLRALAIVAVLIWHFCPDGYWLRGLVNWGEVGVQLFFVLSGFLITGILLRCRSFGDAGQPVAMQLRQFYVRRFLRIFPVFYAAILILSLTHVNSMRETWPWHVTYLSNVSLVINDGGLGRTTHFWTLAVEEQFYLIWPFVILCAPTRRLLPILCMATLSAPVFRLAAGLAPVPYLTRYVLPPACLDTLGMGSLLALLHATPSARPLLDRLRPWCLSVSLLSVAVLTMLGEQAKWTTALNTIFLRLAFAGVFVCVVDRASRGFPHGVGRALRFGPLVHIGRISYGTYVLHHFMPEILVRLFGTSAMSHLSNVPMQFAVWAAASLALASASWHFFERPVNDLKRYFPYRLVPDLQPARHAAAAPKSIAAE